MDGRQGGLHARAERLNAEPPVFRGCTAGELGALFAIAGAIWTPVSVVIAYSAGYPVMGAGAATGLIAVSVFVSATLFQRIKRGRPNGFYLLQIHFFLVRLGLRRNPFQRRSGNWDIGRSR